MTEEPSYWKDLRRILYTRDRFTVYARVVNPQLTKQWNPVKLSGLMGDLNEDLERAIIELPDELEKHMTSSQPEPAVDLRGMFQHFAELITPQFATSPEDADIATAITTAVAIYNNAGTDVNQQRNAFNAVVAEFAKVNDEPFDRENLVGPRSLAQFGAQTSPVQDQEAGSPKKQIDQLEVEVVAIYW